MSDFSQGEGWWQASDGRWYPPTATPGPAPTPMPDPFGTVPPGAAPRPTAAGPRTAPEQVGLGASVGVIVGAFLPWASIGPISIAGTDGDGVLTLLLGIGAAVLLGLRKAPVAVIVLFAITALIAVIDLVDIGRTAGELGGFLDPSIGIGLIVTAASAGVGIAAGVLQRRGPTPG